MIDFKFFSSIFNRGEKNASIYQSYFHSVIV